MDRLKKVFALLLCLQGAVCVFPAKRFPSCNGFSFYYCTRRAIYILVTLQLQLHFVFNRINISKTLSYCVVFGVLVCLFPLCINAAATFIDLPAPRCEGEVFGLVSLVSLEE